MKTKLFNLLLRPIEAVLASISPIIDQETHSQKLFFADFVRKLLFAYLDEVSSLRSFVTELETNQQCAALEFQPTPFSTLKDGFSRFESRHFKTIFETLLHSINLKRIKCLDEIGLFCVIDGSLFPTLLQMRWSEYRKRRNAFKLHLHFELNRMIATEFLVGSGKSSERAFLLSVLEKGCTYIADRGYASFEVIAKVIKAEAFFIFRIKNNWHYEVQKGLSLAVEEVPKCFRAVRDEIIIFSHDKGQNRVRLVQFTVLGSQFKIITNRFDLRTVQIIILYAYRWQIELFFKYLKRTLKRLHLFNQSENGVEIQFYLLMTLTLLLLKFKQENEVVAAEKKEKAEKNQANPAKWIKEISQIFYESWKISKKWLLIVKNSLSKVVDTELLTMLNSC